MANYKTGAQRYNDRMDKIFATAKKNTNNWGAQKDDIHDAQHPIRQKAIKILEEVQSHLCKKCVKNTDGETWYELEDFITNLINKQ